MSGIVLSSSVRQNLLSLQSTADLLATTQNRLVHRQEGQLGARQSDQLLHRSRLDAAPVTSTTCSTASATACRSCRLPTPASPRCRSWSIPRSRSPTRRCRPGSATPPSRTFPRPSPARPRPTCAAPRPTPTRPRPPTCLFNGTAGGTTAATASLTLGGTIGTVTGRAVNDNAGTPATSPRDHAALTACQRGGLTTGATTAFTDGTVLTVNGHTVTFKAGAAPAAAAAPSGYGVSGNIATDGSGNSIVYLGASATTSTATVGDVLTAIDLASGVKNAVDRLGCGDHHDQHQPDRVVDHRPARSRWKPRRAPISRSSARPTALKAFGLTTATGAGNATVSATRATSSGSLGALIQDGSTLTVNGHSITFKNAGTPAAANVASGSGVSGNVVTDGSGNSTVYLEKGTVADVLKAIDLATGVQTAANAGGAATLSTTTRRHQVVDRRQRRAADLHRFGVGSHHHRHRQCAVGRSASPATPARTPRSRRAVPRRPAACRGKTLTFSSFNGGTAVNVTFGDGTGGTVKTLDQLNTALQANNLIATLDSTGKLSISTTNDFASSTLGSVTAGGAIGGTLTSAITFSTRDGAGCRSVGAGGPRQPGDPVQRHPGPDHHHLAGRVVQRRQPARWRSAQADVQRNRQVDPEHHRRDVQRRRASVCRT